MRSWRREAISVIPDEETVNKRCIECEGVSPEGMVVPGCQEAHHYGWDGCQVEDGVEQLGPEPPAAPAHSVDQHGWGRGSVSESTGAGTPYHTLAHQVDEASQHQHRVEVPLSLQVTRGGTSPGEGQHCISRTPPGKGDTSSSILSCILIYVGNTERLGH